MPETTQRKKPQQRLFQIHNLVRRVATRGARQRAAGRHRMNLLLGGGLVRVVRGRYTTVSESVIRRLHRELTEKEEAGMLKVTDHTGRRVNLTNLKPVEDLPAPEKKPEPPLDSAANDKSFEHGVGESKPQFEGGKAVNEELPPPAALQEDIPEGHEEVEEVATEELTSDIPEGIDDEETPDTSSDVTEELVNAVYESGTRKELEIEAAKLGVDPEEGNKKDLARRLAEAGYQPKE